MPRTILVADDNALVRAALRQVLEHEHLGEVVEAVDGEEAVLKAQDVKPDLVILDLAMPFLDGFTTAREIGKILPGTPILMHTLYYSPRVELEAMKAGVRKTVAKSDSTVLIAAVREVLLPLEMGTENTDERSETALAHAEAAKSGEEKKTPPNNGDISRAN